MLGLETESGAVAVYFPAFAFDRAVQKIGGVELHSGLRGEDFEHAAGGSLFDTRSQAEAFTRSVQDPVVVVTVCQFKLRITTFDARADFGALAKIERCSGHWAPFSGWDQAGI